MSRPFKKGDRVLVVKKICVSNWVHSLDQYVGDGNVYVVAEDEKQTPMGLQCLVDCSTATDYVSTWWWFPVAALLLATIVTNRAPIVGRETEDIPGYTDTPNPEECMRVLRSLCGKG